MANYERETDLTASPKERCDIRSWSDDCRHDDPTTGEETYRCTTCGIIGTLDHEVRHEIFPHVSGDKDFLS